MITLKRAKFECFAIFSKISSSFKPIDLSVRIETKKKGQASYYFFEETLKKKEERRRRRSSLKPKIEVVDGCLKTVRSDSSACESSFSSLQGTFAPWTILWFEGRKDKRIEISRGSQLPIYFFLFQFGERIRNDSAFWNFHQLCVIILKWKEGNWRKIRRWLQRFFNEPASSNASRFLLISIDVN